MGCPRRARSGRGGMKGALGSPVAAAAAGAVMQESFGCVVANRFHQLLDDESDPFDILREAERRRQQQLQRKRRDEAAAAVAAGTGNRGGRSPAGASGHRPGAGGGRRESQKERKSLPAPGAQQPDSPGGGPQPPGTCAPPGTWAARGGRGGQEGKENGVKEVTLPQLPHDPPLRDWGPWNLFRKSKGLWKELAGVEGPCGPGRWGKGRESGVSRHFWPFLVPSGGKGECKLGIGGFKTLRLSLYKLAKVEDYFWG